jgi:hypothetical protein
MYVGLVITKFGIVKVLCMEVLKTKETFYLTLCVGSSVAY